MRLKLTFIPSSNQLCLPVHYNYLVQGMIYSNLEKSLANWLHNKGFKYLKRNFKLFTFSKIFGKYKIKDKNIIFYDKVWLKIASPYIKILESFAEHVVKKSHIRIGEQNCYLESVEIETKKEFHNKLTIKTISPITIYSTVITAEEKKKTYYYNPFEPEFSSLIIKNLVKKRIALEKSNFDIPENSYIRPLKVHPKKNFHIIFFKETVIKAWSGIYELSLPEPYITLAYYSGLGSKNSQGFGMWEVV